MGPTVSNLDNLLRLPFGCGEQNMIHFAPNVFVLKYLQKTKQLCPEVESEAVDYLLQGVLELTFAMLFYHTMSFFLFYRKEKVFINYRD